MEILDYFGLALGPTVELLELGWEMRSHILDYVGTRFGNEVAYVGLFRACFGAELLQNSTFFQTVSRLGILKSRF